MQRKRIFTLILCGAVLPLFSAAKPNQNMPSQQTPQGSCSSLSADERGFASQLNDANAMTFCSKMSPAQRQQAMQMAGMSGPSGMQMSPDDAVQTVMQNKTPNNMRQRSGGACPVQ